MKQTYFYIVHIFNRDGYSFMVTSNEPLTTKEVIERCKENHLFDENKDARDAYIDSCPMTEDIVKYKHPYSI